MLSSLASFSMTCEMSYPDWGKEKENEKIAKLPKRIKLKNGQWIYLK